MHIRRTSFQGLLNYIFYFEGKFKVEEIADRIGIKPASLYEYIQGRRYFPPDLIPKLFEATKDRRFLEFFLKPLNMVAVSIAEASRNPKSKNLTLLLAKATKEHGDIARELIKDLEDGKIDDEERERIGQAIYEEEQALESIKAAL